MIDEADKRITEWVQSILVETPVSLAAPRATPGGPSVCLYLLELVSDPPLRTSTRPLIQFALRYLITTWDDDPGVAHRLLGALVQAALEQTEFMVELEPLPVAVWAAFGVPPRPAFLLRVPVRSERVERPAKRVTKPLVIDTAPVRRLAGTVLGPASRPLANARVELPALLLAATTDAAGQFCFLGVPDTPKPKRLRIVARGHEQTITVEQLPVATEPLIIHFDLPEV